MSISRRGFMSSAVALFLPKIELLVPQRDCRPEIVANFTALDKLFARYDLTTPLDFAGDTVATDGRALVRAIGLPFKATGKQAKTPNIGAVYETLWRETGRWQLLPRENLQHYKNDFFDTTCPHCCDKRYVECNICHGDGFTLGGPPRIEPIDCPRCKGLSGVEHTTDGSFCVHCNGKGYGDFASLQPFGDKLVDVRFLRRLQKIPGVRWNVGKPDRDKPILFRSDIGVDGLVMPVVEAT